MKTAYPNYKTPVSIRLYSNIPFDNTYKNHSLISNKFKYNGNNIFSGFDLGDLAKTKFIHRKDYTKTGNPNYYPFYDIDGEFNFDFKNGLIGSVVLELTAEQTNANYMRVRVGTSPNYEFYYYFITGISQVNADAYSLSLELDVLMTYQDEFLEGMKDVPVFTKRKHSHRYTSDGTMPYCADLKTGDDTFSGVKPSLVSNVNIMSYKNNKMKKLTGQQWLYICVSFPSSITPAFDFLYKCKGKQYPFSMLAIPLGIEGLTYEKNDHTRSVTFTSSKLNKALYSLINDGSVHGAKISPYPPFNITANMSHCDVDYVSNSLTITSDDVEVIDEDIYKMNIGNNSFYYTNSGDESITLLKLLNNGFILIGNENDCRFDLEEIEPSTLGFVGVAPSITDDRKQDPKLLFAPFKKYVINAQYSSQGSEIYPELIFSEHITTSGSHLFEFYSVATSYIGDNNFYTSITSSSVPTFDNYNYEKIGLASSVNYIFPCGENALDVFNSTQRQSFYTSKVASGISSGLSLIGGMAAIGVGSGMVATSGAHAGSLTPAGVSMIVSGATAITSGISGVATTIKSSMAKIEDLKNTPDSVNISGSNFISDECIATSSFTMPYLTVYDCVDIIKQNADDFFYNYGYQVARECYFNTELKVNNESDYFIDNNLFGRTIFNYIQIEDDITNKINANIPLLIKQKLNSIFNNGITLWSFYGFNELWSASSVTPTSTYYLDRWFMKCQLDNTEYKR